jgi:dUTP pyrophosphatase
MQEATVRVQKLRASARLPVRATEGSSGYDLYACIDEALTIGTAPVRVPCGIALETSNGLDVQIRPRSGLSARGVMVTFGTIDADYRGELMVTMYVLPGCEPHRVEDGDRIAQLVIARLEDVRLEESAELSASARGTGGHGSTGR